MNLPIFTDSIHCRSRLKCRMCRDDGKVGIQFRETLRNHFDMPGPGLFACPFGENPPSIVPPTIPDPWSIRGPKMWAELDATVKVFTGDAAEFLKWLAAWEGRIGCGDCASHWRSWRTRNHPDTSSPAALYAWRVAAQNAVNLRLGKPQWGAAPDSFKDEIHQSRG